MSKGTYSVNLLRQIYDKKEDHERFQVLAQ